MPSRGSGAICGLLTAGLCSWPCPTAEAAWGACVADHLGRLSPKEKSFSFRDIGVYVGYEYNANLKEVEFTIVAPTAGWIGFGISEVGTMSRADMVVVEPRREGFRVTDRHSSGFRTPDIDKFQNWGVRSVEQRSVELPCGQSTTLATIAVVHRLLDTCDSEDELMTPDYYKNWMVAAYGSDEQREVQYHARRESLEVHLHTPNLLTSQVPKGVAIDLWTPEVRAEAESAYCYVKVNISKRILAGAYDVLDTTKLHHMHLMTWESDDEPFEGAYQCQSYTPGQGVALSWSIGMGTQVFPNQNTIAMEPGEYLFELHFENPGGQPFAARTGFRVWQDRDDYNATGTVGVFPLFGQFDNVLQPGREREEVSFHVPQECMDQLPQEGVTVLGSHAHMHFAGQSLRVFRTRGSRTEKVFEVRGFDFNKQALVWKSWVLMPGDSLAWECQYNMSGFSEPKRFGFDASDEMCLLSLAASFNLPWPSVTVGVKVGGQNMAFCGRKLRCQDCPELAGPLEAGSVLVPAPARAPPELLQEKGARRELCQALLPMETVIPQNNWLFESSLSIQFVAVLLVYQILYRFYEFIAISSAPAREVVVKRALNLLQAALSIVVAATIVSSKGVWGREKDKLYDLSDNEPASSPYRGLFMAANLITVTYLFELAARLSSKTLCADIVVHHSSTLAVICLLVNCSSYEFATQHFAVYAAAMEVHCAVDGPVYMLLVLRDLLPWGQPRRVASGSLLVAAMWKMGVHAWMHVLCWQNYTDLFEEETFHGSHVSASSWGKRPYFSDLLGERDLHVMFDWVSLAKVSLPIIFAALTVAHIWVTTILVRIAIKPAPSQPKATPPAETADEAQMDFTI